MTYPLVHELAADGIPVAVTCRVLTIARQPYFSGAVEGHRDPWKAATGQRSQCETL